MIQNVYDINKQPNNDYNEKHTKILIKKQSDTNLQHISSSNAHLDSLISRKRNNNIGTGIPLYSALSCNFGLREIGTQTDLTLYDLQRVDDLFKAHKYLLNLQSYSKSNPFSDFYQNTNSLYKYIREDKEETIKNSRMPIHNKSNKKIENHQQGNKKKYKKNAYKDIKIYNSVVVNNANPILSKDPINSDYSQRIFGLFNKCQENEIENFSEIEINTMLNQMRGKDEKKLVSSSNFNEDYQIKENIKNENENEKEKENEKDKEKEKEDCKDTNIPVKQDFDIVSYSVVDSQTYKFLKNKRKKSMDQLNQSFLSNQEFEEEESKSIEKDKEQTANTSVLNEVIKRTIGRPSNAQKSFENLNYINSNKQFKRKYDPFNFFLEEYKQQVSKEKDIKEVEKEAKDQWMKLDKETRKIYNIHADREKKLQKQKNRYDKIKNEDVISEEKNEE